MIQLFSAQLNIDTRYPTSQACFIEFKWKPICKGWFSLKVKIGTNYFCMHATLYRYMCQDLTVAISFSMSAEASANVKKNYGLFKTGQNYFKSKWINFGFWYILRGFFFVQANGDKQRKCLAKTLAKVTSQLFFWNYENVRLSKQKCLIGKPLS